jgi:hypothetical protein
VSRKLYFIFLIPAAMLIAMFFMIAYVYCIQPMLDFQSSKSNATFTNHQYYSNARPPKEEL